MNFRSARGAQLNQRGVVLPTPVLLLSIVAVVMAGVAFFVTRDEGDLKVEVPTVELTPAGTPTSAAPKPAEATPTKTPKPKPKPIKRSKYEVVVFNNTSIKGLAATAGQDVTKAGWKVVGADNWYGSIPKTTVYYPEKQKAAGKQLALDLGIKRVVKAQSPMSNSRLTLILTGPLD